MNRKIAELSGAALDYAVALAEGYERDTVTTRGIGESRTTLAPPGFYKGMAEPFMPTISAHGDDIIDREGITVIRCDDNYGTDADGFTTRERIPVWAATMGHHSADEIFGGQGDNYGRAYTLDVSNVVYGATRREAAMRCWAIYELAECRWANLELNHEIDIPEGL